MLIELIKNLCAADNTTETIDNYSMVETTSRNNSVVATTFENTQNNRINNFFNLLKKTTQKIKLVINKKNIKSLINILIKDDFVVTGTIWYLTCYIITALTKMSVFLNILSNSISLDIIRASDYLSPIGLSLFIIGLFNTFADLMDRIQNISAHYSINIRFY